MPPMAPTDRKDRRRDDHEAYLRLAWSELCSHPLREAVRRLRGASFPATDHATRALAWARIVAAAIDSGDTEDFESFLSARPELRDPDYVFTHYSPDRLHSGRARREFVLPDRRPLPSQTKVRGRSGGREALPSRAAGPALSRITQRMQRTRA